MGDQGLHRPVRPVADPRPETGAAEGELMSTTEVRHLLGVGSSAAARVQLHRWRISAVGRALSGEKLWPAAAVRAAHASRLGRGYRSDLHSAADQTSARRATSRRSRSTRRGVNS